MASIADAAYPDQLTPCNREPIHIPGAVQPHGLLLVADVATLEVVAGAGDLERVVGADWVGRRLDALLGQEHSRPDRYRPARPRCDRGRYADRRARRRRPPQRPVCAGRTGAGRGTGPDRGGNLRLAGTRGRCVRSGDDPYRLVRARGGGLSRTDRVRPGHALSFPRRGGMRPRGGSRSGARHVPASPAFPASDIPRQARALYVRNRAQSHSRHTLHARALASRRLRGARPVGRVDPERVARPPRIYFANMDVAASASISIVIDGLLWGLMALPIIANPG
ncbi:hypothetical protein AB5I41_05805 [Sphingomonas sp. MMS24-JH45]